MPERRRMFGAEITNEAVKMVTEGVTSWGRAVTTAIPDTGVSADPPPGW